MFAKERKLCVEFGLYGFGKGGFECLGVLVEKPGYMIKDSFVVIWVLGLHDKKLLYNITVGRMLFRGYFFEIGENIVCEGAEISFDG